MPHDPILQSMCGTFRPQYPIVSTWTIEFLRANILELCTMIIPGESVECFVSDDLFVDPAARRRLIVEYVPLRDGSPVSGTVPLGRTVQRHLFIIRPSVIEFVLDMRGKGTEGFEMPSISKLWSHMIETIREMMQRRCGRLLKPVSLAVLAAHDVDQESIRNAQIFGISMCDICDYRGEEMHACTDRVNVSALVLYRIEMMLCDIGQKGEAIALAPIAGALMFNVPDTLL